MADETFMTVALDLAAQTLAENEFPVGSVVVHDGVVIGVGRKQSNDFHFGHAEIHALKSALSEKKYNREDGLVLYTTVEPCMMCFGTILHCPIQRVVYGFEDDYGGAARIDLNSIPARHQNPKIEVTGGVLREESKNLIRQFLEATDQKWWQNKENPLVKSVLE